MYFLKFLEVFFAISYEWLMQDSLSVLRISMHKFEARSYLLDRACVETNNSKIISGQTWFNWLILTFY